MIILNTPDCNEVMMSTQNTQVSKQFQQNSNYVASYMLYH